MWGKQRLTLTLMFTVGGSPTLATGQPAPDVSIVLDGRYVTYKNDSRYELPGFTLNNGAGRDETGFQLGTSELVLSAGIDDLFSGQMTALLRDLNGDSEGEIFEAYIEANKARTGTTFRAGRILSAIGYLNSQHPHSWDFADAPLIYRGLFGDQLRDDGIQVTWRSFGMPYLRLGAEVTRGAQFPAGGAANDGVGARALFLKLGGDMGRSHNWQIGLSHWRAEVEERIATMHSHTEDPTAIPVYSGDTRINGIDVVWKWTANSSPGTRSLVVQAEYFIREEDGTVDLIENDAATRSSRYEGQQTGWYAQSVYRFTPRWRLGLRYDQLGSDRHGTDVNVLFDAGLDDEGQHPRRTAVMFDYTHSEYSLLRLQYAYDESYRDNDDIVILQYVMSLGAHGAR